MKCHGNYLRRTHQIEIEPQPQIDQEIFAPTLPMEYVEHLTSIYNLMTATFQNMKVYTPPTTSAKTPDLPEIAENENIKSN